MPVHAGGGRSQIQAKASACEELSERERQVLKLVAEERPSKQIARILGISERTVHQHLARIYAKFQVSSRLGAVLQALARGILTLEECLAEADRH